MNNSIIRKSWSSLSRWDFYAFFVFIAVLIVQASNWPNSPIFMDCYYHLCVVRGFSDAGGWVGQAFWEYAPFGRPHLYPPLFHFIELIFFKCGMPLITIARLFDLLAYPLLLGVVWSGVRSLCSKRLAFFTIFILSSSFSLYVAITNNVPFSFAFLFGFLSFLCLHKSRRISALLLLTFSFYTHSLMPWLIVLTFLIYVLFKRERVKDVFFICSGAIFLSLPLLWHAFTFFVYIHPFRAPEYYYAQLNPIIYLMSSAGVVVCLRKRKEALYYFLALMFGMSVLLFTHRDRFLSGVGLVPFCVFAALALDELWSYFQGRNHAKKIIFFIGLIVVFHCATPLIVLSSPNVKPVLKINSWIVERWTEQDSGAEKAKTIYYAKFIDALVELIDRNSSGDDILFFNSPYAGGMMAALAHRATSTGMLAEVKPFREFDPIDYANLVVLLKDPMDLFYRRSSHLAALYGLEKVAETDFACIYLHDSPFYRQIIKARIRLEFCFLFMSIAAVLIAADILAFRKKILKKKLT